MATKTANEYILSMRCNRYNFRQIVQMLKDHGPTCSVGHLWQVSSGREPSKELTYALAAVESRARKSGWVEAGV